MKKVTSYKAWLMAHEKGWLPFPIHPPEAEYYRNPNLFDSINNKASIGKVPAVKNWRKTPYRKPPVHMTEYNMGICLTDWQLILDIDYPYDLKPDKQGNKSQKLIEQLVGSPLDKLTHYRVITGSGGRHYGFRIPAGTRIHNRLEKFPDVDFQSEGRCVVGPTSLHRNGNSYRLSSAPRGINPFVLPECPEPLLNLLTKHVPASQRHVMADEFSLCDYDDSKENQISALLHIDRHEAAIRGQGRKNTTYRLAAKLHNIGISPLLATEMLLTHYNYRCEPQLADTEIEQLVTNAYRYAKSPMGCNHPDAQKPSDYTPDTETLASSSTILNPRDAPSPRTYTVQQENMELVLPCDPTLALGTPLASQEELKTIGVCGSETDSLELSKEEKVWKQRLIFTKDPEGRTTLKAKHYGNLRLLVEHLPQLYRKLRYNLFTQTPVWVAPPPWMARTDPYKAMNFPQVGLPMNNEELSNLRDYITFYDEPEPTFNGTQMIRRGYEHDQSKLAEAVVGASLRHPYHPVRDRLISFYKQWDGVNRLDSWLIDYVNVRDTLLSRELSALVVMAIVTRQFNPGHKYDYMLVLEGVGNLAKSLVPELLSLERGWFLDARFDPRSAQQIIEVTSGKLVVEMPEMSVFSKMESKDMKHFVTSKTDKGRLAYRKYPDEVPRQFILIGTTNEQEQGYLIDDTGNRRYPPVTVLSKVKVDELRRDMPQIYAEAMHRFVAIKKHFHDKGIPFNQFRLELSEEAEAMSVREQALRMKVDERTDLLVDFLEGKQRTSYPHSIFMDGNRVIGISSTDTAMCFLGESPVRVDRKLQTQIGRLFSALGWKKLRKRKMNGQRGYLYVRPGYENFEPEDFIRTERDDLFDALPSNEG